MTSSVHESASVADLVTGPTDDARADRIRAAGLADESGLSWLLDRASELIHTQPATAEILTRVCPLVAVAEGQVAIAARADYLRARICAERGELGAALALIRAARAGYLQAGATTDALRTDLGRMQVLDDMGEHAQAAEVGEHLLATVDDLAEADAEDHAALRAAALGNLGVAYSFIGEHDRALTAYSAAEQVCLVTGPPEAVAQHRANRGIELLALGRAREALDTLRSGAQAFTDAGDRLWAAKCAANVGDAHLQLGELVATLRVLEPAREELARLGATAEEARLQLAIARAYLAAGLLAEAGTAGSAAARTLGAAGMWHDAAFARFTLALVSLASGDHDAAEGELATAAELFDRVGDRQYQARALLVRGELAARAGDRAAAAGITAEATAALRAGGWRIPLAGAHLQRYDLAAQAGDDAGARAALTDAADLVEELGIPHLRYSLLLRQSRQLRAEGARDAAAEGLERAIALVDRLGAGLPDPMLRASFRADKLAAHDELVDLLVERADPAEAARALLVADSARASALTDLLAGAAPASRPGSDPALTELRTDLSATFAALSGAEDPARRALLHVRATELEEAISTRRVRDAVGAPHPSDGDASRAPGELPDAPTLVYHVVGHDVVAFVAAGGSVQARRLPAALPAVRAQLRTLVAQWNRFRLGSAFVQRNEAALLATTHDALGTLYDLLVAPVRELLEAVTSDRLYVVGHRHLQQVPFHALHDGAGALLDRWALTVAPTAGRILAEAAPRDVTDALVLAVPDAHAPAIEAEARALGRAVPGARVVRGDEATSERLRAELPGPGLVHLACHGLYRRANPLFSALRLADRWVTSAEILELDLGGALVTLSACESGRPAYDTAEPVGLAWAFLAAGASGAIVSQWVVDDAVASELMPDMYRRLAAGTPADEALRAAQLALRERRPHPYHWAPFVHVAAPAIHRRSA